MATIYEWDAEERELEHDGDIRDIHHWHHESAKEMFDTMRRFKSTEYAPVVVRDVFDHHDCLQDRQWAYLIKGPDGVFSLPEYFKDGCDRECARVPKKIHSELAKAQGR